MKRFYLFLFLLCSIQAVYSQQIRAFINANKITTDDALSLTLEIQGGSGQIAAPNFPEVAGLTAGGFSQQTQIFNNAMSISFSRTYYTQNSEW